MLEAQAALQQVKLAASASQQARQAELRARQARMGLAQRRLEEINEQVKHCQILAPRDGVVLHATTSDRRSTTSGLEAGATVREGQLLLTMPDLDRLHVRVRVHESQVRRVQVGQKVSLRLDALPTQTLVGKVAEISRIPEPGSWMNQTVVEYGVVVEMSAPPPGLKLGMTAMAEIEVSGEVP